MAPRKIAVALGLTGILAAVLLLGQARATRGEPQEDGHYWELVNDIAPPTLWPETDYPAQSQIIWIDAYAYYDNDYCLDVDCSFPSE